MLVNTAAISIMLLMQGLLAQPFLLEHGQCQAQLDNTCSRAYAATHFDQISPFCAVVVLMRHLCAGVFSTPLGYIRAVGLFAC